MNKQPPQMKKNQRIVDALREYKNFNILIYDFLFFPPSSNIKRKKRMLIYF